MNSSGKWQSNSKSSELLETFNGKRVDEHIIDAAVQVQTSPTFWGWLFQFGADMDIIQPQSCIDTYRRFTLNGLDAKKDGVK